MGLVMVLWIQLQILTPNKNVLKSAKKYGMVAKGLAMTLRVKL
jgi:hypothetical protein